MASPSPSRSFNATLRTNKAVGALRGAEKLGFTGLYPGGKLQRMERGDGNVPIPNPHEGDLSVSDLARLLKRIGVAR